MERQSESSIDAFRIILRYSLDPSNGLEENLEQLDRFIRQSTTNEVMFLMLPEERSSGHPRIEDAQAWCEAIRKAGPMLEANGVVTSINPWTTTYHTARGRRLHAGQNFRLMVGETGLNNGITACPLCENWQAYLNDYFSYLVKETDPVALWIEDDWRLHNHGAAMGYGGCFCDHCLDRFASMAGEPSVSRSAVLEAVTAPGPPHPWRALWLDLSKQALLEPARTLGETLRAIKPGMRIGLMSSIPDIHSIEGRDWNALMDAFTGQESRYLIRPHMPPYTEEPPIVTPPTYTRQTIAELDKEADIYPELENSPRSGPYSGSHSYTLWQITNALLLGAGGITINHFDNMGMNTYYDRSLAAALSKKRQLFEAIAALGLDDRQARGVKILFHPGVARDKHCGGSASGTGVKLYTGEDASEVAAPAHSLEELFSNSVEWSKVFYALGISHTFTRSIEGEDGDIFAVSDQTLRAFSDREIEALLCRNVLLDLPSVAVLIDRGFGARIGVRSVSQMTLQDAAYSYEEVDEHFFGSSGPGVKARMCAQRCADPIGLLEYSPEVHVISSLKNATGDTMAPASGIFENSLGGRIYTTCYPLGGSQFYMAYFNRVRQEYWTKLLFQMSPRNGHQTIACEHPFHLHAHDLKEGILIGASNVIYDTSESFVLKLPFADIKGRSFHVMQPAQSSDENGMIWAQVEPVIEVADQVATLTFDYQVRVLDFIFIHIR